MVDASSPVFYDVSNWPDDDQNDAAGIDRIVKVVCEGEEDFISPDQEVSSNNDRWRVAVSDTLDKDPSDLPTSEVVFEEGAGIAIGKHGANQYMLQEEEAINNAGDSPVVFQNGTGLGGGKADLDYMAGVEDKEDFDYYDSNTHWAEETLNERGYVSIILEHGRSGQGHKVWLGENKTDGFLMDRHPGDDESETETGEIKFEGRMYEDGRVTDPEGNDLGTWK